ncbi:MAG: Npun_R2821/Npun_R2822 family protein [Xenococcus sp. (in: cyanobacteria)]
MQGIYVLANDSVYDQLVALLNSIEVNAGGEYPICIIPYDQHLEKVRQETVNRNNVTIFDDLEICQFWENFALDVWQSHPRAGKTKAKLLKIRSCCQRRYAAFAGPFDHFIVLDADSLVMKPLTQVFEKLTRNDFVFDDWEHSKPDSLLALNLSLIEKSGRYQAEEVRPRLHCCSFWGAKRGLFDQNQVREMKRRLIKEQEVEWLRGVSEAFLFCYMTLPLKYNLFNFTLSSDSQDRTGNIAGVDPFVNINNILYNQDGLKPIHRLHYMNTPTRDFAMLCQGKDINLPHREVYLHYRFLRNPHLRPKEFRPLTSSQKLYGMFRNVYRHGKATLAKRFRSL